MGLAIDRAMELSHFPDLYEVFFESGKVEWGRLYQDPDDGRIVHLNGRAYWNDTHERTDGKDKIVGLRLIPLTSFFQLR